MSDPFIAEIRIFAGNFAPRGHAFCNGQLLPLSQNSALFSILGTAFGGDGRTTVGLPNLQDRVPMHPGRGPGLTPRLLGERGGTPTETLSASQVPDHDHSLNAFSGLSQANPDSSVGMGQTSLYATPGTTVDLPAAAVGSAGNPSGAQSHTNEQPYLTLNFIIALVGTFPSR